MTRTPPPLAARTQVYATAIALDAGRAALLLGPSGAGKSDLALRCILQGIVLDGAPLHARLLADDQVILERRSDELHAMAPPATAGQLEVRGMGIIELPHVPRAKVVLAVKLVASDAVERWPHPRPHWPVLGLEIALMRLAPFEASAPIKVMWALARGLPDT